MEANPECADCLRASAQLHPAARLQIHSLAAAATAGTVNFIYEPAVTGGGQVARPGVAGKNTLAVRAGPLDELFAQNGIDRVGLLKMDIEGSEVSALQGLSRMLAGRRIQYIYFEVNPTCLAQQHTDPPALFAELIRHGYRLFWPHDGREWVLKTYGGNVSAAQLRTFTLRGRVPHRVIGFDPSLYHPGQFGQCDLLAVSPACRIES